MYRTKEQKIEAKLRLALPPGPLKEVDLTTVRNVPTGCLKAFQNNRYVVTLYNSPMTFELYAIRAMVQRHDDKPIPNHWREMQNIKNELFGTHITAIEYYPSEADLLDDHNIYWLFVFPGGGLPIPCK
jgi:hypothetical protein